VDLVRDGLDAVGELGTVRHQIPGAIPALGRPAVVDVDVGIAGILESEADKGFGRVQGYGRSSCVTTSLVLVGCMSAYSILEDRSRRNRLALYGPSCSTPRPASSLSHC
jgi:hypothetical protein